MSSRSKYRSWRRNDRNHGEYSLDIGSNSSSIWSILVSCVTTASCIQLITTATPAPNRAYPTFLVFGETFPAVRLDGGPEWPARGSLLLRSHSAQEYCHRNPGSEEDRPMRQRKGLWGSSWIFAVAGVVFCVTTAEAGVTKVVDRKFPTGTYCPAESRAAAGADLSFVAPASTIRITFSGMNRSSGNQWNHFRVDNVSVTLKSVFDAHLVSPTPRFETCYDTTPPPGQATGGVPNVPSYDFNDTGSTEVFLDLFSTSATGWTGQHL